MRWAPFLLTLAACPGTTGAAAATSDAGRAKPPRHSIAVLPVSGYLFCRA
jgi:hypothetical protein